jgi:hypothetical protein
MERRSPLTAKPLRDPGQSVDESLRDRLIDDVLFPAAIAWAFVILAALEWVRYFFLQPPSPVLYTIVAVLTGIYVAYKIYRVWPALKRLRLARDGEKVVGQFLERLRGSGFQVFHDIVGPTFNIDHVVIGPAGVFTVETKTWSKPASGQAVIKFDGERLTAAGWKPDRDPVVQAKAQVAWLRDVLSESTGKRFRVRPMVLFPGWFIEQSPGSKREIWVLNPKAVPSFLEAEEDTLSPEDIALASSHLSRFIRSL